MQNTSCIILAGGKSSRLPDKPFALLNGKPIILHVIENMKKCFSDITVSIKHAQKNKMRAFAKGVKIAIDRNSYFSPAEGIKSCIAEAEHEWVFIVACDMPFVNELLVNMLASKINSNIDCVIPFSDRLQPLCAFYRKNVFEKDDVNKSLTGFANSLKKEVVYVSEKIWFLNINTKQDLEKANGIIIGDNF